MSIDRLRGHGGEAPEAKIDRRIRRANRVSRAGIRVATAATAIAGLGEILRKDVVVFAGALVGSVAVGTVAVSEMRVGSLMPRESEVTDASPGELGTTRIVEASAEDGGRTAIFEIHRPEDRRRPNF